MMQKKNSVRKQWQKEVLILILITALAAGLRLTGINWDQGHHLHPDERFLTMVAGGIQWPKKLNEYFATDISSLNPHNQNYSFFVYGTFPLFLVKYVAEILKRGDYFQLVLIGRAISAVFDIGTVLLLAFIGRQLFRPRGNLWPAFFYAVSVLPIQLAHFFAVDSFLVFFLVAAFLCLLFFEEKRKIGHLALAGLFLGLAVACKVTALLFIGVAGLFFLRWLFIYRKKWFVLAGGILFVIFLFLGVRIFYPYAFVGFFQLNPKLLANLKELQSFSNPTTLFPPSIQWLRTTPVLFPLKNMILWGLGIPLGALTLLGWFFFPWFFWRQGQKRNWPLFFIWIWTTIFILYQGLQFVKAVRYFIPVYPILSLLAGHQAWYWLTRERKIGARRLVEFTLVISALVWPFAFWTIYTRPHSRVMASEWIYANIPKGAVISCDSWDDCLPLGYDDKTPQIYNYRTEILPFYDLDSEDKWLRLRNQLNEIDYLVFSSNRVWGSIPHAPDKYPETIKFYNDLFRGQTQFSLVAQIVSRPCLIPRMAYLVGKEKKIMTNFDKSNDTDYCWLSIKDDGADESFTVYDHPQILIFKNLLKR